MKCSNDHEVQENDKYCGVCGDEITKEITLEITNGAANSNDRKNKSELNLRSTIGNLKFGNIILYVLILLSGFGFVILGFTDSGDFLPIGLVTMSFGTFIYYLVKSWIAFLAYKVDSDTD